MPYVFDNHILYTATAIAFAEQGCNLLLVDRQHDKLKEVELACHKVATHQITISHSLCDVTNKSQVQQCISKADEIATHSSTSSSSSPIAASILVNCAGITRDAKIANISNEDWDNVLDINLKGTFLMCQAFCEPNRLTSLLLSGNDDNATNNSNNHMGKGGSIINIGSIVSNYGNIGQVNYAASKGGVLGLTRSLAKEMASLSWKVTNNNSNSVGCVGNNDNDSEQYIVPRPTVRVNCIQPGFIATPMSQAVPEHILSDMTKKISLRRLGRAEDVANLALFLASAERSGYITGEAFECSGMLRL